MKLYYHPFSASARRAVMVAVHLQAPVELLVCNLMDQEQRRQLSDMNPNSKVPVLRDGDFVLWESCAIMQYLAEQVPGQTLYPTEAKARADVNRWLFWSSQHFSPAVGTLVWENMMKSMYGSGEPDIHEIKRGEQQLAQFAQVLDKQLKGRQWICGQVLTLADFALGSVLMYMKEASLPMQQYQHIQTWFARVQELDAWKKTAAGAE